MATAGPTTYREFFGVAAPNDPHAGDPTQIVLAQVPGVQAQPAELRAALGTDPNPDPYLFVAANGMVMVDNKSAVQKGGSWTADSTKTETIDRCCAPRCLHGPLCDGEKG